MENITSLQVSFSCLVSVGTHFNWSNLNSLSGIVITPLYEAPSIPNVESAMIIDMLVICDMLVCPLGIVIQKVLAGGQLGIWYFCPCQHLLPVQLQVRSGRDHILGIPHCMLWGSCGSTAGCPADTCSRAKAKRSVDRVANRIAVYGFISSRYFQKSANKGNCKTYRVHVPFLPSVKYQGHDRYEWNGQCLIFTQWFQDVTRDWCFPLMNAFAKSNLGWLMAAHTSEWAARVFGYARLDRWL